MTTTALTVKYRPARIGFLVRRGYTADLVTAAGFNTLLWGGQFNPCLPISLTDNASAEEMLRLFPVDVLYAVSDASEVLAFQEQHQFLSDSHVRMGGIFHEEWRSEKKVSGFLDSKDIADRYWEEEFRHKPADFRSRCVFPKWDNSDALRDLFAIQFGHFPNEAKAAEFRHDYEQAFVRGLKAATIAIPANGDIPIETAKGVTPMASTALSLTGYEPAWRAGDNGVYIGNSTDFDDLLMFWNLRASGLSLSFLATDAIDRTRRVVQAHVDELDGLPDRHPNIPDHISFYHRIVDFEKARAFVEQITAKKRVGIAQVVDEVSWIRPAQYVFNWDQTVADVEKQFDRYTVVIRLPEKKFLGSRDRPQTEDKTMAVSIGAFSGFAHLGYTLTPPHIPALNEFYGREICLDPWKARADTDGIRVIISVRDSHLSLRPIAQRLLVEKLFEMSGIKAERSQPGRIATRILEKLDGIDGGRVLKIKGVRKLLQELKPDESVERGHATKTIFENDFAKHKGLYIEPREKADLGPQDVFSFLLKKNFFRAGLELQCDDCKLDNWLSLNQLDDDWVCAYCGEENKTSLHLRNRGDWKFRKSGLFAKDNNQEGAIPVILTLLVFVRVLSFPRFAYTTAMKLTGDGIDCESDFTVLQYERGDEIECVIGECKSEGGKIDAKDCENLKGVYGKLVAAGWSPYIVFSKTADSFDADEIALFAELHQGHVQIVLLTNKELEPYHPYWEKEDEGLPHKHAVTLRDMSENSIVRYLGSSRVVPEL